MRHARLDCVEPGGIALPFGQHPVALAQGVGADRLERQHFPVGDQARGVLAQSYIDRIEKSGPVALLESRTPEEARSFMGLPDVGKANEVYVDLMAKAMKGNSTAKITRSRISATNAARTKVMRKVPNWAGGVGKNPSKIVGKVKIGVICVSI